MKNVLACHRRYLPQQCLATMYNKNLKGARPSIGNGHGKMTKSAGISSKGSNRQSRLRDKYERPTRQRRMIISQARWKLPNQITGPLPRGRIPPSPPTRGWSARNNTGSTIPQRRWMREELGCGRVDKAFAGNGSGESVPTTRSANFPRSCSRKSGTAKKLFPHHPHMIIMPHDVATGRGAL